MGFQVPILKHTVPSVWRVPNWYIRVFLAAARFLSFHRLFNKWQIITLPKSNSKSPWKMVVGRLSRFLSAGPIFRGYVSLQECMVSSHTIPWKTCSTSLRKGKLQLVHIFFHAHSISPICPGWNPFPFPAKKNTTLISDAHPPTI